MQKAPKGEIQYFLTVRGLRALKRLKSKLIRDFLKVSFSKFSRFSSGYSVFLTSMSFINHHLTLFKYSGQDCKWLLMILINRSAMQFSRFYRSLFSSTGTILAHNYFESFLQTWLGSNIKLALLDWKPFQFFKSFKYVILSTFFSVYIRTKIKN